ncbi:MAG: proline racemase family protein [Acidimicrobiia bacterium]
MPPTIRTVEMHTGGEPVRIVVDGYPELGGDTIMEKRRDARENHDHLRRLLMFEPRGHADMYGVIPVRPDHPEADLAVLFMHNEGYSTMCGHATIALGRWAVDRGIVKAVEPETRVALQVPAGLVRVTVDVAGGRTGRARFESVPAFVAASAVPLEVTGVGTIPVDVAYGGAFYAFAPASAFGLAVRQSPVADLVDAAWALTTAASAAIPLSHPDDPDLEFLYGSILTDGADDWSETPTANICVFADRQVDRSPTGSGVTARIALQHARGQIAIGTERRFESIVGSQFTGKAVRETKVGDTSAVIVEVGGMAHYTGESVFTLEEGDDLPAFLVR